MFDITQLQQNANVINKDLRQANIATTNNLGKLALGKGQLSASDNITNVSLSAQYTADVDSLHEATKNVNSATSLLRVADGGLQDILDILQRMEALALQAEGGAYNDLDRMMLDKEFQVLFEEVDRIAINTRFNNIQVLTRPEEEVFTDQTIVGTVAPENLDGGGGNDVITGFDGDDIITGGAGNDQINPGFLQAPGLQGRIYQSGPFGGIANLAEAEAIIAAQPVQASFVSSLLDYPNGAQNNQNSTMNNFLGVDAGSLDVPVAGNVNRQVFEFTGFINVPVAGNYQFNVGSDDGYSLQINGAVVSQFPNNRGFNFTNANVFLPAGQLDFRLVFWENGGQEGLEVFSDIGGPLQILDDNFLTFNGGMGTDGNDTIDGGDGTDIVSFTGNQADYTVNIIAPGQAQVIDNRPGAPDGTDNVVNVEILRFADTDLIIGDFIPDPPPPLVLEWQVHEDAQEERLEYEIVDARSQTYFEGLQDTYSIGDQASARIAIDAVQSAIQLLLEDRSYIGGQMLRAESIGDAMVSRFGGKQLFASEYTDANIATVSTELAKSTVKQQTGISLLAQSNRLNSDVVTELTEETLQFGVRPLDNGPLVNMRTQFDI